MNKNLLNDNSMRDTEIKEERGETINVSHPPIIEAEQEDKQRTKSKRTKKVKKKRKSKTLKSG